LKIIGSGTWEHLGFQSVRFLIFNQAYDAGLKGFKDFAGHSVHHPARLALRPRSRPGAGELGVPLASVRVLPLHPIRMSPGP
jgi:hypothetical protein